MVPSASTPAERTARLQAILDGTTRSRSVQHSRSTNLLFGVALHAAAKADQAGGPLTDLERLLHDALGRLLPAEEVAAAGRAFTQAQSRAGGLPLFPPQVAVLPVTGSYDRDQLLADIPVIGAQVMAQPNCNVITLSDLEAGRDLSTPEFLAGMEEYGGGLTVITSGRARSGRKLERGVSLWPKRFRCQKRTGDSITGPSDEIYWMAGGGSDTGDKTTFASPEYGDVDTGDERPFAFGSSLFKGTAVETIMLHIECWEKDTGGFFEKIRGALADVAEYCVEAAEMSMDGGNDNGAALAALIGLVAALLGEILELILPHDDLIQQHEIAIDMDAIEGIANNGLWVDFKGSGGHYRLLINATASTDVIRHMVLSGGKWSQPEVMPYAYARRPRLAQPLFPDKPPPSLYCIYFVDNAKLRLAIRDDDGWNPDYIAEPEELYYWSGPPPAFYAVSASHPGDVLQLYETFSSMEGPFEMGTFYPGNRTWNHGLSGPSNGPQAYPEVAVVQSPTPGQVFCVFFARGDTSLYAVDRNPADGRWGIPVKLQGAGVDPIALAVFDGMVHCVCKANEPDHNDHRLSWLTRPLNGSWGARRYIDGHFSATGASLAVFEGKLHCVYRGHTNNSLWHMTLDRSSGSWSQARVISGTQADDVPSLAVHKGKLHCVYGLYTYNG